MIALLDSDIFVYRVGSVSNDDTEQHAKAKMDVFLNNLLTIQLPEVFEYELYLTGKDNFRHKYAKTVPYKGNRKSAKPTHYAALRQHLQDKWQAQMIEGMEADDMLAIRQTELEDSIIVTLDKDLDQVIGWHYNFVKDEKYYTDKNLGDFLFFCQFLTGDRVDNIVGVKGIGAVKAKKLLEGLTEAQMWDVVVYELGMERAIENGHLLYMLRSRDDSFIKYLDRQGLKHG